MTLNIHHLVLDHIGAGQTIDFKAALSDSKPPGEIAMNGKLGPWNSDDPASVPIHGSYTYDNADLGVFHGIGGKLSSHGKFDGTLEKIAASGVVEVPKFHVHGSSHSVPIHGEYHADILGHTGEIKIVDARAQILHTSINGAGNLSPTPGKKGRTLSLNLESTKGRIEDLLTMFQGAPHPSMSGSVNFHAHVVVPPGNEPFLRKLLWDGDFGMGGSKFHNPKTQGALNHLTESAAGEKKDQIQEDPRTFVENLRGHVTSRDGVATLSHVSFAMPGTSARMDGTYGLMSKIVDFHGTLYTDGKLSDSTTGIKSFFMKAMSPFIKKKEQTTVVPFTITGTSKTPKFALDLLHRSKD